ncbi:S16 family serine protease [Desulfobacter sp.]|uniref:S16 family serine protease n=1 Tax=Desulfobacter sp. TaxID=2294 RepID=UPI003D1141D3
MGRITIQELEQYLSWGEDHRLFLSPLLQIAVDFWHGPDSNGFHHTFGRIVSKIHNPDIKRLLFLTLWSQVLTTPSAPDWVKEFLNCHLSFSPVQEVAPGVLAQGCWKKVPVLLARCGTAEIAWFTVGCIASTEKQLLIPQWAHPLMDKRFLDSAQQAEHLVRRQSTALRDRQLVLFPVALPGQSLRFNGGSAGLAFGLGFKNLVHSQKVSKNVIATGCLDRSGPVTPVGELDQKIKAAEDYSFKCMIYPAGLKPGNQPKTLRLYGVAGFDEAWMIACLYSEQTADLLDDFSKALKHPDDFIRKMDRFPKEWLTHQASAVRSLLKGIFKDLNRFSRFAHIFFSMTRDYSLHETATAIAELAPATVSESWPMAALTWCTSNLALANHLGRIRQAEKWAEQGKKLTEPVMSMDADLVAEFFNTLLVSVHNRFEFSMNLPRELTVFIDLLEKRHTVMKESGCLIDQTLGRLYGTLVQNWAFCGPALINQTETMSLDARQALGENISLELKNDWMRQYDYLTAARLQAGDRDGAASSLKACLEIDDLCLVPDRLDSFSAFQISSICRFLVNADPGYAQSFYHPLVSLVSATSGQTHPWQLVFFNLGRMALGQKDRKTAVSLLEKSVDICFCKDSVPTIEVMALKPLAFMPDRVLARELVSTLPEYENRIRHAAGQLNPDHFSFLKGRSFCQVLAYVRENHDTVFPFSYV